MFEVDLKLQILKGIIYIRWNARIRTNNI